MTITKLDAITSEQIAAGEIVENPASIVKELVENALDAGAKRIKITLKKGGIREITVTDDGSGIYQDELRLSVERYATSKIESIEDLNSISSLGFRGEALPSIASVSKMSITSRHEKEKVGTSIYLEGNKEKKFEEVGFPVGTRVTVTDLFYNTPARKKFLKGVAAETAKVSRIIHLLALSRPDVSFSLIKETGVFLETSGDGKLFNVIINLYGTDLARELVTLDFQDFQDKRLALKGYISNPSFQRNSRNFQVFFVNKRYVRNQIIKNTLDKSFSRIVTSRKHPAAFLFLSVAPEKIDVNVHPSKIEIRFHQEESVQNFLGKSLQQAFSPNYFIPRIQKNSALQLQKGKLRIAKEMGTNEECLIKAEEASEAGEAEKIEEGDIIHIGKNMYPERIKENASEEKNYFTEINVKKSLKHSKFTPKLFTGNILDGSVKGQVFGTYILLEKDDGLIIIDQHAAHERILWEEIQQKEENKEQCLQEIIPFPLEVPSFMAEKLKDKMELLHEIGLEMDQFGNNTFIVRTVPFFLKDVFTVDTILAILDDLSGLALSGREYQKETLLRLACSAAVKANKALSREEIKYLLVQLGQCKNPFYCPHGRPVMIKLEKYEIEQYFKRRG